uniref:HMA domain-containing protein n=1 Tax=Nelumbo nucifera TaxID=4432 RepID=A0A822XQ49_NELNU|nr:TPA_asm: hypothetical protein HUJ06_025197 [Nelumbo nucifera]
MKQKIVVKVQMNCDKCRSKAMSIASVAEGVISVAIEGDDKDRLVVIGDGVDSAKLTTSLRKKVGHATIISVEEVKPKKDNKEKSTSKSTPSSSPYHQCTHPCHSFQHSNTIEEVYTVVYDDPDPNNCSVM